ncbi:MAG: hypothetical protein R2766_13065 [Saprospiraceae bacterium]
MKYDLIFVLLWQHIELPLVHSQTLDQAQKQSEIGKELKPKSVSVWIMTPLRFCLGSKQLGMLKKMRLRCPGINIQLFPEINRLNNFPLYLFLKYHRKKMLGDRVVFHFRGEETINHFTRHYRKLDDDSFFLDVRGYWPAELLYANGVEDIEKLSSDWATIYDLEKRKLRVALGSADGVITVSQNLANLLKEIESALPEINVIPCSVSAVHARANRDKIRQSLRVESTEKLLVYSGGYARYQHLEDLTIPFINLILQNSEHAKVLILSQDMLRIQQIVKAKTSFYERFIFRKVEQIEVADYLSACDLGLLLRKESLVNIVAQPVKVGEYLAAGVPVCVEGEVGGVTSELMSYEAGLAIHIADRNKEEWIMHAQRVLNFLEVDHSRNAQLLAQKYFLWDRNVLKQRQYYQVISSGAGQPWY